MDCQGIKIDFPDIMYENSAGHHVLFLPPYSPDFNPIEQVFATLKKNRIHQDGKLTLDDTIKKYSLFLE